jgi:Ca-activated chloride channel family protein
MKTTTTFDYTALPAHSTFNVRLMLTLLGDIATVGHQAPLNIAMVIDNSGSMHGEKITKVKEAACMIVGMLAPHDIFSLVTFNDKVNTIVPTAKGADLAGVDKLINMITAGGNTDLSAGYNEGCNLAFNAANIAASRVVLLSDGIANRGHMHGADIARKFRYLRISTTTFGVGDDFDEVLLTSIAEEGGGSANFIQHPWQAADVFREELEDLRNITATNTRVRFTPGQSIVSHTLLNNFTNDGDGSWLIGDVYGTKERRIVIEMEIKTGEEIADLNIGSLEILYDIPGKGTTVPMQLPVLIPVVSSKEFTSISIDNDVTLEAALLAVGRAKREALNLSLDQKFIEAADVLERYISAISGLLLNDLELDRELQQLKERAWNLRHRGKEFFTAVEKKHFAYEADMTGKGKKEMYRAMLMRRDQEKSATPKIAVTVHSLIDGRDLVVECSPTTAVSDFLKDVFNKLDGAVKPNTYGVEWVLRDAVTSRILDVGSSYAKAQGVREDRRMLNDVSINGCIILEAVALTPLTSRRSQVIPSDIIRLDINIDSARKCTKDLRFRDTTIASDFLAVVYDEIKSFVPPNSYGRTWLLRDMTTGRVFDAGSGWAKFHQLQADVRPIDKVGIKGGSMLQVVTLKY